MAHAQCKYIEHGPRSCFRSVQSEMNQQYNPRNQTPARGSAQNLPTNHNLDPSHVKVTAPRPPDVPGRQTDALGGILYSFLWLPSFSQVHVQVREKI